jgi:hypothetical protein
MNKPEYSDLYKFISSLGIILIAFAVLLPWLFLREPFETHLSAEEIDALTQTAQTLIGYRQTTALWFYQYIPWISLALSSFGLGVLICGLKLWWGKQKLLDQSDKYDLELKEHEIRSLSPAELAEKAIEETFREEGFTTEASEKVRAVQEHFRTEELVFNKLIECFGPAVLKDQLIGTSRVDGILMMRAKVRAVIEVKRVKNISKAKGFEHGIFDQLSRAIKSYKNSGLVQNVYGVALFIISDNHYQGLHHNKYEKTTTMSQGNEIVTITVTEREFYHLGCTDLRAMFMGDKTFNKK